MDATNRPRRLGLWLIGARGSIATCVAYGLSGLRQGLLEPVGLATCGPALARLPLRAFDAIVLGGHEIGRADLSRSVAELATHGILERELVAAAARDAARYDERIRPGILDEADVEGAELHPEALRRSGSAPREQVRALQADLEAFRAEEELERVVVCYLASTEAWREPPPEGRDLAAFERALDEGASLPASCLYAYAALSAGAAFVNFTPNLGASLPALRELALARGVPHCGNDGKTGETLLKTVLAPMFAARGLRVLAWQGYNMLGNADGRTLADPLRRETKRRSKDDALLRLLGPQVHTGVGIDYVPSLHDWKTAWDFVHFEGFLGARMSLQLTWMGCDSALAAPLVIDLARLADHAAARGEAGVLGYTGCFFKAPLGGGPQDFHGQFAALEAYARACLDGDPHA